MVNVSMVEAVSMALSWEMENDESVVMMGEDIATSGGVFRATNGLERLGNWYVRNGNEAGYRGPVHGFYLPHG